MKCNYDLNDAFDYLDGVSNEQFSQHLDGCGACTTHVADCRAARAVWKSVDSPELTDSQWASLDRKIRLRVLDEESETRPSWLPTLGRQLAWTGALAALAIATYVSFLSPENQKQSPPATVASDNSVQTLSSGDAVTTGKQHQTVTVAEARMNVAPQSRCKVASLTASNTVVELQTGSVTFDVKPRPKGVTFQVKANDVMVTVVGTRFTVEIDDLGAVLVSVEHGQVSVQQGSAMASLLSDGDTIRKSVKPSIAKTEESEVTPTNETTEEATAPQVVEAGKDAPVDVEADESVTQPTTPSVPTKPKRSKRATTKKKRPAKTAKHAMPAKNNKKTTATEPPQEAAGPVRVVVKQPVTPKAKVVLDVSKKAEPATSVEATQSADPGRAALRRIVTRIGKISYSECVSKLKGWMSKHRRHRKWNDAYYALGYCEFRRGNKKRANKIFTSKRLSKHRMLRKTGDYFNPRRPR